MKKVLAILLTLAFSIPAGFAADEAFVNQVLDVIKNNPRIIKEALEQYDKELADKQKEDEFKQMLTDRAEVKIGDSPIHGNKKAKYTVVAFSDFQCPFCKRGDDTVKELEKKYGKDIRYIFKHFPLSFHPQAAPASKACWAAGKQDKFYEYHDKLFENQASLGEELYVKIAEELKLNIEKFNKDRASEDAQKQIDDDMKVGQEIGIRGTPGFVLNGVKIFGAYPLEHFEKVITALEEEKKTAKN